MTLASNSFSLKTYTCTLNTKNILIIPQTIFFLNLKMKPWYKRLSYFIIIISFKLDILERKFQTDI